MANKNGVKFRVVELPKSKYSTKAPYPMTPKGITIHNTYNDASAASEIAYMQRNNSAVSFHNAIDDKEVVQGVPYDRNTWHAGDGRNGYGNRNHISYEICHSKSGGAKYRKAMENTVKVVAHDLKVRGWGINKIKKHQDWSGKYCPHRILDEREWQSLLNKIKKELDRLNGKGSETGVSKPKPAPAPKPQPKRAHSEDTSLAGKRVESIYGGKEGLNFYDTPRWDRPTGVFLYGQKWTIVSKINVGGGHQYKVKNSKGQVYYITASPKYVKVLGQISAAKPTQTANKSTAKTFRIGQKIKIKSTAKYYSRTKNVAIPAKHKNKTYTIQQMGKDDVLIKELYSWVRKADTY